MINLKTLAAISLLIASTASSVHADSVFAKHEMIAAANPYAAKAGLEMLHEGGSAVDAAIARDPAMGSIDGVGARASG